MDRKIKTYLFDFLTCIEEVEQFFEGKVVTLESLLEDIKTIRAVERELEIIGEATKKLIKISPSIAISDTRKIISARNYIAHEYGAITYETIVKVINENFPVLKKEGKKLLEEK
ncbi:HepT-like ribonuclease domain-containing protein [Algoriphagus algorifonticola]|uniref:HepT-like ribonuclease domain-containing protein n=1 Tax=Algoriphagus algorifonticola TaxID=2593007 RepID=UPI0011A91046|nr:HepT-like ribonuclease domain-containing protein [Algoriphagus algorifonticola]